MPRTVNCSHLKIGVALTKHRPFLPQVIWTKSNGAIIASETCNFTAKVCKGKNAFQSLRNSTITCDTKGTINFVEIVLRAYCVLFFTLFSLN